MRTTINRLPSTIYLPDAAATSSTPEKGIVKSLSALPSIDLGGGAVNPAALSAKVQTFVTQNAKELGLDGNAAELVVKNTRETLTGHYVDMEQRLDGIPIIDGQVQLTVNGQGAVQSVARNVVDVPTASVINEYVDVADAFYNTREKGFVNGLLDAVAKDVRTTA